MLTSPNLIQEISAESDNYIIKNCRVTKSLVAGATMTLRLTEESTTTKNQGVISVEGDLTIYTVKFFMESILEQIYEHQVLSIHLFDVGYMDAAGIHSLEFLKKYAESEGKELYFASLSNSAMDILDNYTRHNSHQATNLAF